MLHTEKLLSLIDNLNTPLFTCYETFDDCEECYDKYFYIKIYDIKTKKFIESTFHLTDTKINFSDKEDAISKKLIKTLTNTYIELMSDNPEIETGNILYEYLVKNIDKKFIFTNYIVSSFGIFDVMNKCVRGFKPFVIDGHKNDFENANLVEVYKMIINNNLFFYETDSVLFETIGVSSSDKFFYEMYNMGDSFTNLNIGLSVSNRDNKYIISKLISNTVKKKRWFNMF